VADQTVITFTANGPDNNGLGFWEPYTDDALVSGDGIMHGDMYFKTENGTLYAGVWDSTACELVPGPYEVDEFMLVLEGAIEIAHQSGQSQVFSAGESFALPRGVPCTWKQAGYVRKFFVIFENPIPHTDKHQESDGNTALDAIPVDLSASLPRVENQDAGAYLSDVPDMGHLTVFKDPSGQMEVGIWECSPMQRKPATLARSELMHILEGSGSITNADGVVFEFRAGDTFLVPIGMGYQWHNTEYVKKVFCSFTPSRQ
jgi:uncharacterized cupin superfamily protein